MWLWVGFVFLLVGQAFEEDLGCFCVSVSCACVWLVLEWFDDNCHFLSHAGIIYWALSFTYVCSMHDDVDEFCLSCDDDDSPLTFSFSHLETSRQYFWFCPFQIRI